MERCKFNDTPEENHNSWSLKRVPESVSETPHTVCGRCFGSDIVWSASDFFFSSFHTDKQVGKMLLNLTTYFSFLLLFLNYHQCIT